MSRAAERAWRCPKCPRVTKQPAAVREVSCPPLMRHPKGWGAHIKTVWMVPE